MKVVVLGTGMVGTTIVRELSNNMSDHIDKIIAVDGSQASLDNCLKDIDNKKVTGSLVSVGEHDSLVKVLSKADIAIGCLPHSLSLPTIKATIEAKCHLIDLVGSNYEEKKKLDAEAKEAGIIIIPGCGVAPGIVSFLAARGVELLDEAEEAVMVCGGIPRHPLPPLWYQIVFRLESVMGLYTRKPLAAKNGKIVELTPFSGLERFKFPSPVGECEAINSDAHSVAFTLKDKVKRIYEKTVRYKGHFEKMNVLHELGFLDDEPIEVEGELVSPKQFTMSLLEPQLKGGSKEDITVLRVTVEGKRDNKNIRLQWEMVDLYDSKKEITSMAKTTGYPAILMAELVAKGTIDQLGVITPEELIIGDLFDPFMEELKKRGIDIKFTEEVLSLLK